MLNIAVVDDDKPFLSMPIKIEDAAISYNKDTKNPNSCGSVFFMRKIPKDLPF